MVKSFKDKEPTKIKRIPAGCNKVRTELSKFDKDKHEAILVLLVEALIKQGYARIEGNDELTQKVKNGTANLSADEYFLIV